ncbi:MAG TPA: UTP--glucose-1-phosphate uridylyltransferase [Planctomycetaceae bacterium]|nr:UTP--glucose-1-phosphate uridylyltransferase [Planctomycetaceae bacterium]
MRLSAGSTGSTGWPGWPPHRSGLSRSPVPGVWCRTSRTAGGRGSLSGPSHRCRNHGQLPISGPFSRGLTDIFPENFIMAIDLAVVPVAGQGTRLLPSTKSQPKEMLPVGRKPVVQYVVEELANSGIGRLMFITGPGKASIENHFDTNWELITFLRETGREELLEELDFERQSLEYFYTRQRRQLGLGHAVLCARSLVGDQPFVVALGDSIIGVNAQSNIVARMVERFEADGADVVVAFEEVPREEVVRYGIARPADGEPGDVFELADLVEKPSVDEAPSQLAVAARYVLSPRIFATCTS